MITIGGKADHGFDEPLGLLSDCHRRIEWFLGAMLHVSREEEGRPLSAIGRRALEQSIAYFDTAGVRHTADEEVDLFPRLRASSTEEASAVMAVIDRLEEEHRQAEEGHATVKRLVAQWLDDDRLPAAEWRALVETLKALQQAYQVHIAVEDRQVFPAAARILSSADLEDVGRAMAARRGARYPATAGQNRGQARTPGEPE